MTSGPLLFARYAYPPNELGYCGPDSARTLLEHASTETSDPDLRRMAAAFDGAWPYLTLLAEQMGRPDPLNYDVVHAYWLGNHHLRRVSTNDFGNSVRDRFRTRANNGWTTMSDSLSADALPHHSFHVFCVYPWVGLLRSGTVDPAMRVLDQCRIRTGVVIDVMDERALIKSRRLDFAQGQIVEGDPTIESARVSLDGASLSRVAVGDWVSLHWDWVCEPITEGQSATLERLNQRHIDIANRTLRSSPLAS